LTVVVVSCEAIDDVLLELVQQGLDYFVFCCVPIVLVKYIRTKYVIRKTSFKIESRGSVHMT